MKKLKQIIIDKGLKQCWIAKRLGIAEGTLCWWVTGRSAPSAKQAGDLAELLGVTAAEIDDNDRTQ